MTELDVTHPDGRTIHAYDTGGPGLAVFWQHGTPNIGAPPVPLFGPGLRWVGHDRPGYGGSTPQPGRTVARPRATSPPSRTPWGSSASPSSVTPAAARTRWLAARCWATGCSPW